MVGVDEEVGGGGEDGVVAVSIEGSAAIFEVVEADDDALL